MSDETHIQRKQQYSQTRDRRCVEIEARERVDEMLEIYTSAANAVRGLIQRIDLQEEEPSKKLTAQLAILHELFARVHKAEEAFQKTIGEEIRDGEIDFDAARMSIGGRLDRIRKSLGADGVSG